MDINRVTLVGRLVRDPEVVKVAGGKSVTRLSLATVHARKLADGTTQNSVAFHAVALWGTLGEKAAAMTRKGKRVLVEGRLQYFPSRKDAEDERPRSEIVGDTLVLLDPKPATPAGAQGKA